MNETKTKLSPLAAACAVAVLVVVQPPSLAAQAPHAVSPGSAMSAAPLAGSCPTFSWSGSDNATAYELVLYRVTESGTLETEFQTRVEGARASSWTPSAAQCLSAEAEYAWAVRAFTDDGSGPWSEPLLFATPGIPTDDEVRHALEVLRRHQTAAGNHEEPRYASEPLRVESRVLPSEDVRRVRSRGPLANVLATQTVGESPSPRVITPPSSFSLALNGDIDLGGFVFKGGLPFLHNDGGSTYANTALGLNALASVTPASPFDGGLNTAVGNTALRSNTTGFFNTALGASALYTNTTGLTNVALGANALWSNETGSRNTATGADALRRNTTGANNTASGIKALYSNTTASENTATGSVALFYNTVGYQNTALGTYALLKNTLGNRNTASGARALRYNTTGNRNTATGFEAMRANTTGFNNVAAGYRALFANDGGARNTVLGHQAMPANTSGGLNTAIGYRAGYDWTTGSSNIAIGHGTIGVAGESGVIRIGGGNNQTKTYIEGIAATNVSGVNVLITAGDQLGVAASSARFKRDIRDLEAVTDRLQELRPVSFRYKDELARGGANPLEYGLIAEEVAEIFPELVVRDEERRPYTVRYHLLTPLLLAEIQRQHAVLADQRRELDDLRQQVQRLTRKRRFR